MPKRKSAEAAKAPPVAGDAKKSVSEPKKRASKADRPLPAAATTAAHKHHNVKNAESVNETPAKVAEERTAPRYITHLAIAQLAHSYWEAGGRQNGTADKDWLRAEHELSKLA